MEFKGTKGEWNLGYKTVKVNDASILFMPIYKTIITNKIIAVAYSEHGIESEVKANALLISKAPEMLEEIKESIKDLLCLQGSVHESLKVDKRWDGVYELLQKQIDRKKQLIKEATEI